MKTGLILGGVFAASLLLAATGCKENQMEDFKYESSIYFENKSNGQRDSLSYSFFDKNSAVTYDTIYVRVNAMGLPVDHDRPIRVVQANAGAPNAAQAGVHFVPLDDPTLKDKIRIPAGAVYVDMPIVALRSASLVTEKRLVLAVEPNEHFRVSLDRWLTFVVKISDNVKQPAQWAIWGGMAFGPSWSVVKMKFIIDVTGISDFDAIALDVPLIMWCGAVTKQALADYNAAHPGAPLTDENGYPVSMSS